MDADTEVRTKGEQVMGELLHKNIVLIPFTINPLDQLGPLVKQFLHGDWPQIALSFPPSHPNAAAMHNQACTSSRPIGIIPHACAMCNVEPLTTAAILWTLLHSPNAMAAQDPGNGTRNHQSLRTPPTSSLLPYEYQATTYAPAEQNNLRNYAPPVAS